MGWKISMILINTTISEQEKLDFVKKYYRSFENKGTAVLDNVLLPSGLGIYIGEYNHCTIITHNEIPRIINHGEANTGTAKGEKAQAVKLMKAFPKNDIFCCYFNSVSGDFGYTAFSNRMRTRYKNNIIIKSHNLGQEIVHEGGALLKAEESYYAASKIIFSQPKLKLSVSNEGKYVSIQDPDRLYTEREYYFEGRTLNEYQCAYNVIMDTTKSYLGEKLELLHLENIKMTEYSK